MNKLNTKHVVWEHMHFPHGSGYWRMGIRYELSLRCQSII